MLSGDKILAPGCPYSSEDYDRMAGQCLDLAQENLNRDGKIELCKHLVARAQVLATLSYAAAIREANRG